MQKIGTGLRKEYKTSAGLISLAKRRGFWFLQCGMKPLKRSGAEIMAWRTGLGRPRRWLADQLGVSPKTIESWEYGARNPSGPALLLIEQLIANTLSPKAVDDQP